MAAGLTLLVAGIAVFAAGAILLFRITSIRVPGRHPDDANARTGEYYGYTNPGPETYNTHRNHDDRSPGGGHDGDTGAGN